MTPRSAIYALWGAWVLSWLLAAIWSKPAAARPSLAAEAANRIPTVVGFALVFFASRFRDEAAYHGIVVDPLWRAGAWGWALVGLVAAGFAFTWWARIFLGALWSGNVTLKEDHRIVESGPYRLVRHPIYTGLILATAAAALEQATPAALAGLALVVLGFWLKARLEERFLASELGEAAYADYRRQTPMLIPFWPLKG